MIQILENSIDNTSYYTQSSVKTFGLSPSDGVMIACIRIDALTQNKTINELTDKVNSTTTFELIVTNSGHRDGIYTVTKTPIVISNPGPDFTNVTLGISFLGERIT